MPQSPKATVTSFSALAFGNSDQALWVLCTCHLCWLTWMAQVARQLLDASGDIAVVVNSAAPGRQSKGFTEALWMVGWWGGQLRVWRWLQPSLVTGEEDVGTHQFAGDWQLFESSVVVSFCSWRFFSPSEVSVRTSGDHDFVGAKSSPIINVGWFTALCGHH